MERHRLTAQERELWELLQDHIGPGQAITQEEAGRRIGLLGGVDTIRRKVQHLVEGILDSDRLVLASSGSGMFLPSSQDDVDRYFAELYKRAVATMDRAKRADRKRAARLARDLVARMDADEPEGPEAPVPADDPDLPRAANLRPGERPSDGELNGRRCWCGTPLRGRQEKCCSKFHNDLMNGRRAVPDPGDESAQLEEAPQCTA